MYILETIFVLSANCFNSIQRLALCYFVWMYFRTTSFVGRKHQTVHQTNLYLSPKYSSVTICKDEAISICMACIRGAAVSATLFAWRWSCHLFGWGCPQTIASWLSRLWSVIRRVSNLTAMTFFLFDVVLRDVRGEWEWISFLFLVREYSRGYGKWWCRNVVCTSKKIKEGSKVLQVWLLKIVIEFLC